MPFVKLDCGILDSTLWIDRDAREVFITALLMAQPREFLESIPQYDVDAIKLTGWAAPPGWYGFVEAAGPGIVRRAMVEADTGKKALRALGDPDPESRSKKHEGRRLIRVNGGYLVLNFIEYRDKDHTTAERSKRYRERLKAKASHRDVTPSHRDITQAEAESYAEAKEELNPKTVKAAKTPPSWFQDFKSLYPPRSGDPNWAGALRAANARIQEGCSVDQILEGARRYARFTQATEKTGTEFVQQASRFLGPSKGFLLPWYPPPKAEDPMQRLRRINGLTGESRGTTFDIESSGVVGAIGRDVRD